MGGSSTNRSSLLSSNIGKRGEEKLLWGDGKDAGRRGIHWTPNFGWVGRQKGNNQVLRGERLGGRTGHFTHPSTKTEECVKGSTYPNHPYWRWPQHWHFLNHKGSEAKTPGITNMSPTLGAVQSESPLSICSKTNQTEVWPTHLGPPLLLEWYKIYIHMTFMVRRGNMHLSMAVGVL